MRNLKRALSLALASVMLLGMMVVGTSAASYPDVDSNDNVEAIEVLQAVGAMKGDENGKFNPDDTVTRNEMATVIARLMLGAEAETYLGTHPFTDVPGWADKYVAACYNVGAVKGTSATTYNGTATVTAQEAATMMLRVLGYEQIAGTGADWARPVVAKANEIRLFRNVTGSATAPLTRNQVAQLALNALEADMVEYVTTPAFDGTAWVAQGKYEPRKDLSNTSGNDGYNYTKDPPSSTTHQKEYLQLCEDLYDGKLIKDTHNEDAYDRPATKWEYKGKVIGKYMNTPDAEYHAAVKLGDIYADLGLGKTLDKDSVAFSRNGKYEKVSTNKIQDNGNVNDTYNNLEDLGLRKGMDNKIGGNGVLTQVWYDSATEKATITMIDTYAGKIGSVVKATSSADRYVKLGEHTASELTGQGNKFETESFEVGDIVSFQIVWNDTRYDVDSVAALEKTTTGTLEKYVGTGVITADGDDGKSNSNFTVDGTTYKYSAHKKIVDSDGTDLTTGKGIAAFTVTTSEINVYLDKYDYALYVSGVEGETNYAAVIGTGAVNQYGDETRGATLLLPDGTKKTVTAKRATGSNLSDSSGNPTNNQQLVTDKVGDLVTYTIDDKGVYELTVKDNWDTTAAKVGTNATFVNGKSELKLGGSTYYTTDKTVFFVATGSGTDWTYDVYTGYNNMPSFDTSIGIIGFAVQTGSEYTTQIEAIYIAAANLAGTSAVDTYFVKEKDAAITTDKKNSISYYTLPAIVDGERTTVKVKVSLLDTDNIAEGLYAIKNVITNSDGIITSFTKVNTGTNVVPNASVFNATSSASQDYKSGTVRDRQGVLGIGTSKGGSSTVYWAYTKDTKVYVASEDYDDIWVSSIGDVYTDTNDLVYASMEDNTKTLVDVIIVEQEDKTGGGDVDAVEVPDVEVSSTNWNNAGKKDDYGDAIEVTLKFKLGEDTDEETAVAAVAAAVAAKKGWTYTEEYEENGGNLVLTFKDKNGTLRYAKFAKTEYTTPTVVAEANTEEEFTAALNNSDVDEVVMNTNASAALAKLNAKTKGVSVAKGAKLTISDAGEIRKPITGEGTVKIGATGSTTGVDKITAKGGIELATAGTTVDKVGAIPVKVTENASISGEVSGSATITVAEGKTLTLTNPVNLPTITGTGTVSLAADIAADKANLEAIVEKVGNDQKSVDISKATNALTVTLKNNGAQFIGDGKIMGFDDQKSMNGYVSGFGSSHGAAPTAVSLFYFEVPGVKTGDRVKVQTVWVNGDKTNIGGNASDWTNGVHTITETEAEEGWGMLLALPNNAKAIEVTYTPAPADAG